jgi:hypothetical protein
MLSKLAPAASIAATVSAYSVPDQSASYDDDCSNFNGNLGCTDGQQTRYPDDWSKRSFQTFLKDGPDAALYKDEYEGLGRVMCYNQIVYSKDKSSATVSAKCRQHDSITKLEYNWNS